MALTDLGRVLLLMGGLLFLLGLVLVLAGNLPFLGRLPGDISIQREGFSFFFPLVTSLILSLILTVVLNIVFRIFK
jgi:hypothetical protein